MQPQPKQQIEELFQSALELAPEPRRVYLADLATSNPELHDEVASLLRAHERADTFIEHSAADAAAALLASQLPTPRQLGQYRIEALIGAGGMAEVYRATDRMGRPVALKMLTNRHLGDTAHVSRFVQEARAVLALNHPNIVTVYDIGEVDGIHYIASELIDGETLRDAMAAHAFTLDELLDIATQAAAGVAAAHAKGIVHRDIKPENVMIRADGYVKVLDFGIAKSTRELDDTIHTGITTQSTALTREGLVIGTTSYMSPEQTRGGKVDARTDVWSFGVMLYEMLAGRLPFAGDTQADVIGRILEREPTPLRELVESVPEELQGIVAKMLQKDPQARLQTMSEVVESLKALRQDLALTAKLQLQATPVPRPAPPALANTYVFVCYAHADATRVYPHIQHLRETGVPLWFDQGIRAGTVWRQAIAEALDRASHVVFFVSAESLASDHCDREVQYALDNQKVVIPVFLERVELTPAMRISLSRVQALYKDQLSVEALREALRSAIVGDDRTEPSTVSRLGTISSRRRRRRARIGVAAALVALAIGAAAWLYRPPTGTPLPTRSIAVLPFVAMSDDSPLQHLADGFVEELLNDLTAERQLRVAARTASSSKSPGQTLPAFAAALGVSYVLEGSLRPNADGVRVTAQLIRGSDGLHLLSRSFTFAPNSGDLDSVAGELSAQVFRYVDNDVLIAEARTQTASDEAFAHYAEVVRLDPSGEERATGTVGQDQALLDLDKAIELDPGFAEPYIERAFIVSSGLGGRLKGPEVLRETRRWVDRYLELRPDSARGRTFLGNLQAAAGDLTAAEQSYQRARELDPQFPWPDFGLGSLETRRGRLEQAADYFKQATVNDGSRPSHYYYAMTLLQLGRYDEAEREFDVAMRVEPDDVQTLVARAAVAQLRGDDEQAKARFEAAWARHGQSAPNAFVYVLASVGHQNDLHKLMQAWDTGTVPATAGLRAMAHVSLGEDDAAIDWLLRAIDEGSPPAYLRRGQPWQRLRANPRYAEVLAKLNASEVTH